MLALRKHSSSWTLSSGRTRTLLMRSRICWISLEKEVALSMTSTNRGVAWSRRRRSCRQLWKRLKELLSKKRTKCCGPSWSLEQEKEELQAALEEAEGALEQEENKVLRSQLELSQVRQEIDRRVAEKEEEFNTTRKNHQRAMESMSASLESEQRAKSDALRVKKKLEGEINELEIGLDHANKANAEGLKAVKRYQLQLRETIQAYEEEAKLRQQISEACGIAERKGAALSGEAEESRALLDSADRAKRQIEAEIADSRAAVNEMTSINSRDMNGKRALEGGLHTMQAEIDAVLANAKNAEEKSKKAMIDAARLADELRAEQDHTMTQAGAKKALESQFGDH